MVGKRFLRSEYDFSGNDILIIIKPILKNVLTPTINKGYKIEFGKEFKIIYHQIKIYPKTSTR